ncbi:hypothetical protein B296_00041211, partial [Ensete ventricosum]
HGLHASATVPLPPPSLSPHLPSASSAPHRPPSATAVVASKEGFPHLRFHSADARYRRRRVMAEHLRPDPEKGKQKRGRASETRGGRG